MNNVWVFPYKPGSNSARELSQALDVRRISHRNSTFRGRPGKTIINWGASRLPEEVAKCTVINAPDAVHRSSDKLQFFRNVECRTPEWTEDFEEATAWYYNGDVVVERHVLNGHSGQGIELADVSADIGLGEAPLYTKYVKKRNEYRVHVFNGQVIDVQRKARSYEVPDEDVDWRVRNAANGFIFARNGDAIGDVPDDCLRQSVDAVTSLGLSFGAADVVYNDREQLAYVLEVNTAPGLAGTTIESYQRAFNELLG